jgi:hypothetical protein
MYKLVSQATAPIMIFVDHTFFAVTPYLLDSPWSVSTLFSWFSVVRRGSRNFTTRFTLLSNVLVSVEIPSVILPYSL